MSTVENDVLADHEVSEKDIEKAIAFERQQYI